MEWTSIVDCAYDADINPAAAHTSVIATTIQLKDFEGNNLTVPAAVFAYLASDSDGLVFSTTNLDSEMSIEVEGSIVVIKAHKYYLLVSNTTGYVDISMGYTSGAKDYYLVLIMPDGKRVVSSKIEFTD